MSERAERQTFGPACVTGAGSGIGRAVARCLAAAGAEVLVTDIDAEGGRETVAAIEQAGGRAAFHRHDVTLEDSWRETIARLESGFGGLRTLVNNAAICINKPLLETSLADWQWQSRVNVEGAFLGLKHAIPLLRASGGGAIVNVSSAAGTRGLPGLAGYCASKAALLLLTRCAALECAAAADGIRVNAVVPGGIETPIWAKLGHGGVLPASERERQTAMDAHRDGAAQATPLGRAGTADEVAELIVFLASDRASFITGESVAVDGGVAAT